MPIFDADLGRLALVSPEYITYFLTFAWQDEFATNLFRSISRTDRPFALNYISLVHRSTWILYPPDRSLAGGANNRASPRLYISHCERWTLSFDPTGRTWGAQFVMDFT